MHIECGRIEIEHYGLFPEAEPAESTSDHIIYTIVKGLLDVYCGRLDEHGMLTDFSKSHHSFLEFKITPPVLDPVSCAPLDDHVYRVLLKLTTEKPSSNILLNHGNLGRTIEQRLKEAKELLVFVCVDCPIVVENGK